MFLDESAAKTNMTRLRGRCPRGDRLHFACPHGHWRTTTMISSVRLDGSTACMAIEGASDTGVFRAYVREVLIPTLRVGDIVVMDNLTPHKNEETLALIEETGACFWGSSLFSVGDLRNTAKPFYHRAQGRNERQPFLLWVGNHKTQPRSELHGFPPNRKENEQWLSPSQTFCSLEKRILRFLRNTA